MSSPTESKYPVEPLPRLLLPADYLHNPLFFTTEWADAPLSQRRTRSQSKGTPSPKQVRSASEKRRPNRLQRELDFSAHAVAALVDSPSRASGTRTQTGNTSAGTSSIPRSRPSAMTKSARLREQYILERELERIRDEERRRRSADAPERIPPPPRDDVDERMLRPTKAAQLRQQHIARRQQEAEETEKNIYVVKGQDTSRASRPLDRDATDASVASGRLTKAAQLLREHTMKRLRDLEEERARREAEDNPEGFSVESKPGKKLQDDSGKGKSSSLTSASRHEAPPPRRTKAEALRKQHITERLEALRKERAAEEAIRDAILYGPGSAHYRENKSARPASAEASTVVTTPRQNSPHHKPSIPAPAQTVTQPRGENKELAVRSVNAAKGDSARTGLPERIKGRTPAKLVHADPNATGHPSTTTALGLAEPLPVSNGSSRSSSISFYVEVLPQHRVSPPNEDRQLEETHSRTGSDDKDPGIIGTEANAAQSPLPTKPTPGCDAPAGKDQTVVDLTPVAEGLTRERQRSSSLPSFSSFSTIATAGPAAATADASQVQAALLRKLREGQRLQAAPESVPVRVPVMFRASLNEENTVEEKAPPHKSALLNMSAPQAHTKPLANTKTSLAAPEAEAPWRSPPSTVLQQCDGVPDSLTSIPSTDQPVTGPLHAAHAKGSGLSFPVFHSASREPAAFHGASVRPSPKPFLFGPPPQPPQTHHFPVEKPAAPLRTRATPVDGTLVASQIPNNTSSLMSRTPVESILVPDLQESTKKRPLEDKSVTVVERQLERPVLEPTHSPQGEGHIANDDFKDLMNSHAHSLNVRGSERPSFLCQVDAQRVSPPGSHFSPTRTSRPTDMEARDRRDGAHDGTLVTGVSSHVATPPRDVRHRDGVREMRKAPKECSPPPSDVRNDKHTQTQSAEVLEDAATSTNAPSPRDRTRSPRRKLLNTSPKSTPAVGTLAVPPKCGALPVLPTQPPSKGTPSRRGRDPAVSVRPRNSPAKRLPEKQLVSVPSSLSSPTLHSEREAELTVSQPTPNITDRAAQPTDRESTSLKSSSSLSTTLTPQGQLPAAAAATPAVGHPSPSSVLASSMEHPEEKEPSALDSSFVPVYDDDGVAAEEMEENGKRLTASKEDGRPDSHAPTPVRYFENPMEAAALAQSSPPPRPSNRARSGSLASGGEGTLSPNGPTRFILPELSVARRESESLPRPTPHWPLSVPRWEEPEEPPSPAFPDTQPSPAADTMKAESEDRSRTPHSDCNSNSSSFVSTALRDKIVVELPPMQTEPDRLRSEQEEALPLRAPPTTTAAATSYSAISDTSSSFRDASAEPDSSRALLNRRTSLSKDGASTDRVTTAELNPPPMSAPPTEGFPEVGMSTSSSFDVSPKKAPEEDGNHENPLVTLADDKDGSTSPASSSEELATDPLQGESSRGMSDVADKPLDLDERPSAPVPIQGTRDPSASLGRYTGDTNWSAGSPLEGTVSAATPLLSDRGGAEELLNAFDEQAPVSQAAAEVQLRYITREF